MAFNFSYRNLYENIELNLYTCGFESCKSEHSYGPAVRSGYLIHLVLSGKGIYKVNNKTYNLKAGNGFLIYPNELIYYKADKNNPWEYAWIGFTGTKINEYIDKTSLTKNNPVFSFKKEGDLVKSIDSVIYATNLNSNKNIKIIATLYDFIYNLLEEIPNDNIETKITPKNYVEDALFYIQNNYQENISVSDIANYLSLDRSYFHKIFKKYTNKSPQEYILYLKFEKASELLLSTNLKVGDIARSIGYSDIFLFSKNFKKVKGVSPSEYRKINK